MSAPTVVRAAKSSSGGKGGDAASAASAKKSKKKLVIIVVAAILVLGVGYKMMAPKKAVKPGPPVEGLVVSMDAMTLNLADGHFLKLQMALQEIKGKGGAELDTSKAADLAIREFSGLPMSALATDAAREAKKAELLAKLEVAYPKELMAIYFKGFVMQ